MTLTTNVRVDPGNWLLDKQTRIVYKVVSCKCIDDGKYELVVVSR